MSNRTFVWDEAYVGSTADWTTGTWSQAGYPGDSPGVHNDTVEFPEDMERCYVNAAITIQDLTIDSNISGWDVKQQYALTVTGNLLITQGELDTGDEDLTVTGYTNVYGTLTPGASTCYFGYGNTASSGWDLGVRGTGILNAGTGDWYTGGVGFYSGADVTLTAGTIYISGTHSGLVWSPDQSVGSWDNNDGTVIIQKTGDLRIYDADPLTASDNQVCPFHTLIISGGTDRTDAPDITLIRGLKVDNELIIKNGVLKWNTNAGSYGDVWAVEGTHLSGPGSSSAAIVMDDMPVYSRYVSATGSGPTGDGFYMEGNAIVSGATAKIEVGNVMLQSDFGTPNSAATGCTAITGLNGSPYFHFPSGEACAVFDGNDDYIDVGNDSDLNITSSLTVTAWVKSANPTQTNTQSVVRREDSYSLQILGSDGYPRFFIYDGTDWQGAWDDTALTADTWYHLTGVYDTADGSIKIYVDGVLGSDTGTNEDPNNSGVNHYVGSLGGSSEFLNGNIADVRIYAKACDVDDALAFAATNPATSITGTYPSTGSGLRGWWKLQPYQIADGTGSGEMDFSNSSVETIADATNNGTVPGWGGLWLNNEGAANYVLRSYQRTYITNNTSTLGVEGRGSTVYMTPSVSDLTIAYSDGYWYDAVTQYDNDRVMRVNNLNINDKTAGNGEVHSLSDQTANGVVDCTGDLFVASGATFQAKWGGTSTDKAAMAAGDIYVSGNALIWGTADLNNSTFTTATGSGYVGRMPQLTLGSLDIPLGGVVQATPYITRITNIGAGGGIFTFFARYGSFIHNDGTVKFDTKDDGPASWYFDVTEAPFYNVIFGAGPSTAYDMYMNGLNDSVGMVVDNDCTIGIAGTTNMGTFRSSGRPVVVSGTLKILDAGASNISRIYTTADSTYDVGNFVLEANTRMQPPSDGMTVRGNWINNGGRFD